MYLPFENMPDSSRIWIYQANQDYVDDQVNYLETVIGMRLKDWAAHGDPLVGGVKIFYNRFVVIALDQSLNNASGCSIDASTSWLKELGAELNINFFDRSVLYLQNETLNSVDFLQVKNAIIGGEIKPETIIFNNLVSTKADFNSNWKIQAINSWLKPKFELINKPV
jgi:hypothetical protein